MVNTRQGLQAEYEAASKGEKLAGGAVEEIKQGQLNDAGVEFMILNREATASRDLYKD